MNLTTVALAHLRRHLGKSLLMIVGLATAVGAFVAVLSLIMSLQSTMDDRLARYGASVTVTPRSPELSLSYGGITLATAGTAQPVRLPEDAVEVIGRIPSSSKIAAVLPVLLEPVDIAGNRYLTLGTDIATSASLKPWWRIEGALPASSSEVLLGLNARNRLGLEVGETVGIGNETFRVSGVLWETGGEEDNAIILDYEELVHAVAVDGQANLIEVIVSESDGVDTIVRELQRALPDATVASVRKSLQFNAEASSALSDIGVAATVLIAVVAVFVVVLTMLAAVRERQKEIGVLRAVGYRRRDILSLLFRESLLLSMVSAAVGVSLGVAGAALSPQVVPDMALDFVFSLPVIMAGVGLAIVLGAVATVYPATVAARLDPALALKRI